MVVGVVGVGSVAELLELELEGIRGGFLREKFVEGKE